MAIVESLGYHSDDEPCLVFQHLSVGLSLKVSMEGTSCNILHDEENLFISVKGLVEFCYASVLKPFHYLDFPFYTFLSVRFEKFQFFIHFHGYLSIRWFVEAYSNYSISSLSNDLSYDVII